MGHILLTHQMTENYRPAVDLSVSILARRPRIASPSTSGGLM